MLNKLLADRRREQAEERALDARIPHESATIAKALSGDRAAASRLIDLVTQLTAQCGQSYKTPVGVGIAGMTTHGDYVLTKSHQTLEAMAADVQRRNQGMTIEKAMA
jgi:hypothetical protein